MVGRLHTVYLAFLPIPVINLDPGRVPMLPLNHDRCRRQPLIGDPNLDHDIKGWLAAAGAILGVRLFGSPVTSWSVPSDRVGVEYPADDQMVEQKGTLRSQPQFPAISGPANLRYPTAQREPLRGPLAAIWGLFLGR
jgi:hypothetical protein